MRAIAAPPATRRAWTMNSNFDYYVKTNEAARFLDLALSYRHTDGRIEPVGSYMLDLDSLVERGVVTRRRSVHDIRLDRAGGRFWIGVRSVGRVLLAEFAK
jgi:hypothetical protein